MKRLFLLEDDLSLINGLSFAVRKQGYEIDVARTTQEADNLWKEGKYDLVILDVSLPDGSGFDFCRKIRRISKVPVMFLTAADEETDIIMGLDIGGDDYITKPFKLGELCSRIRALLRRSSIKKTDNTLKAGPVTIDQIADKAFLGEKLLDLTGAEYRLLCLLVEHDGQTMTRNAIFDALWDGNGNFVDDNTLSVYIRRLRGKIEEDPSHPKYLITVRGFGYRWEGNA